MRCASPAETENHEYFECHELQSPAEHKVPKRIALDTHWGLLYSFGDDPYTMRGRVKAQEELDYYV